MMGQGNLRVPCVLLFSGRLEVHACGSSGPFLCPPIPLPLPEMTRLNHTHDWVKGRKKGSNQNVWAGERGQTDLPFTPKWRIAGLAGVISEEKRGRGGGWRTGSCHDS
jgi:hypothetical protein